MVDRQVPPPPTHTSLDDTDGTQAKGSVARARFFVVGVGASAGGLEALETFFENVPRHSGMAYVVLQHLSPDFESRMDELLARKTDIPIHRVTDGVVVEPDAIYLIPPKKEMIISDGRLLLTDKDPARGFTLPIDHFFRSLAHDCERYAVGVVLSGTGSDGSRGVREIHEVGGLVIAQTEESARFDGMPRSARETGCVDLHLPPADIPAALVRHAQRAPGDPPERADESDLLTGLEVIFHLLREEYGIDFAHYKPNTVGRRIERRIAMAHGGTVDDYARKLREDPIELNALYRDLLIGVTRFFRDEEAFARLESHVLPSLLARVPPEEEIRVWVAGCATGEEAYSIAMLLHEHLERAKRPINLKIFATDVHKSSLDFASHGTYGEEWLEALSPARRARYFTRDAGGFTVSADLRQTIVFARHNLLVDAPFTRLDLVTCRNLLIYLQPQAQRKALSFFHFGLRAGGTLFLGPSESPGELVDEFDPVDKYWRIYKKRRDIRLPADMRLPLAPRFALPSMPSMPLTSATTGRAAADHPLLPTYDRLLTRFMPPSVLVDERHQLLHCFGDAERYVQLRAGRPSMHLFDLLTPELKTPVSGALQHAHKQSETVRYSGVCVRGEDGEERELCVTVEPMVDKRTSSTQYLVLLEEAEARGRAAAPDVEVDTSKLRADYIASLEDELRFTKESLQATIEELETSNEELQATNEELVASNEELQSTNEELHSVNEELYTVNAEHQRKITELTELTDDMDNLLHSTELGVVFLDAELCIRRFTSRAAPLFRLLPQDLGRPFDNFVRNIDHPPLHDDIRRVLDGAAPMAECEVRGPAGEFLLLRVLPYRHRQRQQIGGVVLTLIDISTLKRAEADVRRLSALVESSDDAIFGQDFAGTVVAWNHGAEELYGFTADEAVGRDLCELCVPEEHRARMSEVLRTLQRGGRVAPFETAHRKKDGSLLFVSLGVSPIIDERGAVAGVSAIARDITLRRRAEEQVRQAVRQREEFLAMLSHELRNPLAAVLSASRVLQAQNMERGIKETAAVVVQRQSEHMARLLDDLLDVSRMRQDKIELRKEPMDLREIVPDVVEAVRPQLESVGAQLEVKVHNGPLPVHGDATRLKQLAVNLLANAAKHSPRGGRVLLELERCDEGALVRVKDEGAGIAPDMLTTIFEPFTQALSLEPREGLGLGLALVRSIAQAHDGTVEGMSEGLGRGAEFVARLPLSAAEIAAAAPARQRRTRGRRIVLVEDEEDSRELLGALLQHNGYEVVRASDGAEGIARILEHQPDIAIVDAGLPVVDGLEVARRVREKLGSDELFLIALTGFGQQRDREAVFAAGFDRHLVKPVQLDVLLRVIDEDAGASPHLEGAGAAE